ncbi:YheC/YheD family endospore coat-associated protein [Bacillus massilinigeriensis]|uniref:YheC/YheD family endospore coat-associated protein n=1 Tax=Bacillus massilionigeriensis TaxID=1805475 RepID=UPI00096B00A8|nr:YheC/YheD family protein [Bacillus massilionigeriensis]
MLSLGFMTLSLFSETQYFSEIASRAKPLGITCYRFIPSNINPLTEKVKGEVYNDGQKKWMTDEFKLPDILYDRCFYIDDIHSRQCQSIVNWLKTRRDVTFLGYGLPDKFKLYSVLSQSKLEAYLPKTEIIQSSSHLSKFLAKNQPMIIKPVSGSGGFNIYYLEKIDAGIVVKTDKNSQHVSHLFSKEEQFSLWLNRLLSQRNYLMQPYLSLTNMDNQPFDIRTLIQKDATGDWTIVGKTIRQGEKGGLISNLQAGASSIDFDQWIEGQPLKVRNYLLEELNDILTTLPSLLEQSFNRLFEIGVDIGFARNGSLWILDINSKPGRKGLLDTHPELKESLYTTPLLYSKAIQHSEVRDKEEKSGEEKVSNKYH